MLAPFVLALGLVAARRSRVQGDAASAPIPWFVLGFVAVVALNSIVTIPVEAKAALTPATAALLTVALAAMGLETDVAKLKAKGLRPFALGFAGFLFIAVFGLAMAMLVA